ncbi:uncharacterized protein [Rhodnius prolixus]|uniref:uncharacterized protein n=1 Tax=Rhodnius prolixus TaxID=13249 RepID=UPI003D18FA05
MSLTAQVLPSLVLLRMELKANRRLFVLAPSYLEYSTLELMVQYVYGIRYRSMCIQYENVIPMIHCEFQLHRQFNSHRRRRLVCGPFLELKIIGRQLIMLTCHRNLDRMLTAWILEKTLFPGDVIFQFVGLVKHDIWFHTPLFEPLDAFFSYFERSRGLRMGDVLYIFNKTIIYSYHIPARINMVRGSLIEVILNPSSDLSSRYSMLYLM